ncbi:glycoside hydrolase family 3 protein [Salinisphaera sp.]|uniref:glycoside hydrolase family 3 protein n=1 Tax=Salinisphaera sp. TaxID=1914330 RepID=UPI002D78A576|nr:glycoside hydrolase family 3 protein [Salinisphaera sp.]HET7312853.1 glycoside hydrolase family 3 protein [Salinisphaera sp.]
MRVNDRAKIACRWLVGGLGMTAVILLGACNDSDDTDVTIDDGQSSIWPALKAEPPSPDGVNMESRIADMVDSMTLEEKVGQMTQPQIDAITPAQVKQYNIGTVLSGGGTWPGSYNGDGDKHAPVSAWVNLANELFNASLESSSGIPLIWGIDAVHGNNNVYGATIFPHHIALGATRDEDLVKSIAQATAEEVAVTGLDWAFAPTVAVVRNIRWGRTYESYSQNPELVAKLTDDAVEGLQGTLTKDDTVIATAKHYIGDGGTTNGNDQGNTQISEERLAEIHGPPYFSAIKAGVQAVMVSFNSWNGQKMSAQKHLITDVLKNKLGFDGLVVSDYNAIGQVEGCTNSSCAKAVNAGIDVFMVPYEWQDFIASTVQQVKDGVIPMSRINDAVSRILRVKIRAGVFDAAPPAQRPLAGKTDLLGSKEHLALARKAVRESLVLLKNRNNVLPLDSEAQVLVAGKSSDSMKRQAGGWTSSWQGTDNTDEDLPVGHTIWEGIQAQAPNARLDTDGSSVDASTDKVAIVVVGEPPYAEFMGDIAADSRIGKAGADTLSFAESYPEQFAVVKRIHDAGIPVVTVLVSGRPLYTNALLNLSDAFVAAWLPGSAGAGVADVLFRDDTGEIAYDFTGKLPFSWPNGPCMADIDAEDYDPLFEFGYGLRYGQASAVGNNLPVTKREKACKTVMQAG